MSNSIFNVLESINELQVKLEGVTATSFTIAEAMKNDKNFAPSINLMGIIVGDITEDLKRLVEKGHEISRESKKDK